MVSCTEVAVLLFFAPTRAQCVDFQRTPPDFRRRGHTEDQKLAGAVSFMTRILFLILCLGFVAACDSGGGDVLKTPTEDGGEDPDTGVGGDDGAPIESERNLPPGTESPVPSAAIFRREEPDDELGNGFVRFVSYNSDEDTFFVEGLAFDGNQPEGDEFSRATPGSLGERFDIPGARYSLYEQPEWFPDSVTGTPIRQFQHRALYGVSDTGETEFAIVRTGQYINYGFGGFIYQRNGGVVLPAEGQGTYQARYGAIRDFDGRGGLEYADGRAEINIDFSGFRGNCVQRECDNAIQGTILERRLFNTLGEDITLAYLDALSAANGGVTLTEMPVISFKIGPNVADANGELFGTAFTSSREAALDSGLEDDGSYFAILAGDHTAQPGGEIVGVVVIENDDPRQQGVTVRETGGFIAVRQ